MKISINVNSLEYVVSVFLGSSFCSLLHAIRKNKKKHFFGILN